MSGPGGVMSLADLRAALDEHAQTCAAPSDAFSAGLWCETAGGLLIVADALLARVAAAEAERDALREALKRIAEFSYHETDTTYCGPCIARAVLAASVPSGPAAGPTTSKETR